VSYCPSLCLGIPNRGLLFNPHQPWRIDVGGDVRLTSSSLVLSYAPPIITALSNAIDMPTNGTARVTITGLNFGPLPWIRVEYGPTRAPTRYTAANCTLVALDTVLSCMSVEGVGSVLHWRIVAAEQEVRAGLGDVAVGHSSQI
jgi:hypothetical protein